MDIPDTVAAIMAVVAIVFATVINGKFEKFHIATPNASPERTPELLVTVLARLGPSLE